jgi:glycosyltransferase involved in cell wall biosynthesis
LRSATAHDGRNPPSKKILWVVGVVPHKMGGFERTCVELARQASARGLSPEFVFEGEPCTELALQLTACQARWTHISDVGTLGLRQTIALARLVLRTRPDYIHLHFCEFYVPFFLVAWMLRIPLAATYHYSGTPTDPRGLRRLWKHVRRRTFEGSLTHVTAPSEAARTKFLADYLESPDRVAVLYNGTDVCRCSELPDTREHGASPQLIFVGSLIEEKGPAVAVEAVSLLKGALPGLSLRMVGEGPQESALRQLSSQLGVADHVTFLGSRDDVPTLMTRSDIFLMPSIWNEAFGFVLIEAMSVGCPVIASAVGGIPEVVAADAEGLLVPPADPRALANAILRLWTDPELRSQVIANALRKVDEHFQLGGVVNRYLQLYE